MKRFRMVRYRVRVHMRFGDETSTIDFADPDDLDRPFEARSEGDAKVMAKRVADEYGAGTWCETYEVQKRIKPTLDNVAILVLPRPDRTASGLILAEQRGREDMGEVLAVGPLVKGVCEGEIVKFDPYALRLVIDDSGMDMTNSVYAKAGSLAILREESIGYVSE